MLNQADLQTISTVFGKTVEEISGAISSEEEVSLDFRLNGKVYTTEEIEAKTKVNKEAYIEIGLKNVAKEAGIELSPGEKDPKIIATKLKENIVAGMEEKYKNMTPPEELKNALEKTVEWENKYNQLNSTYEEATKTLEESNKKYSDLQSQIKIKERNNKILSAFPEKMKMDKSDALLIVTNTLAFENDEIGNLQIKKDGKTILDAVGENETLDNVIKSFAEEKGWMGKKGVKGNDRNPDGDPRGMTDEKAIAYMEEKGIDPMSNKGSKIFLELTSKE